MKKTHLIIIFKLVNNNSLKSHTILNNINLEICFNIKCIKYFT